MTVFHAEIQRQKVLKEILMKSAKMPLVHALDQCAYCSIKVIILSFVFPVFSSCLEPGTMAEPGTMVLLFFFHDRYK